MIRSDNHVHTVFSSDSEEPLEQMLTQAVEIGLSSICITDHMDYDFPDLGNGMNFEFDPRAYIVALQQIRPKFPNLEIRQGVELGLKDSALPQASALINNYDFDFVIGSSHVVHGYDPYYGEFFENREESACYREYFESILENLEAFSGMDVYGHIDYLVRYGPNQNK